jgi:hypothetical protein
VTDFATLKSCTELTSEHAKLAASSSVGFRNLLTRVAQIAKPGEGCPKVLMAVARLVGQDWLDGELRVELSGDDTATTMIVMCDYGVGIRERLVPSVRFAVPIDEFGRALELSPKLVLPLQVSEHEGLIILTPLAKGEAALSVPAPKLAVDDLSLGTDDRATAPPPAGELQVVDEATPSEVGAATPRVPHLPGAAAEAAMLPELDDPFADELLLPGDGEHDGRSESGSVVAAKPIVGGRAPNPNVHTRPTVRRMVAVDAAAIAALKRRDPRREEE